MKKNPQENHKKLVLLIEDEEIIVKLLQARLESAGYLVGVAKDGISGLAMIRDLKPNIVLLDMMLPFLSGFGILEKLHEEKIIPQLPVIIISNSGQQVEADRALKLGVRDYLIKVNFDPADVLAKISRILQEDEEKKETPQSMPMQSAVQSSPHILIIEDDLFLADLLVKKFAQQGYTASNAIDKDQALKTLEANNIDLILLDLVLPGTDGLVFLSELKQADRFKDIPVIIISNLGQQDALERGKKAGAVDYIVKANTTPSEIFKKVEAIVQKH